MKRKSRHPSTWDDSRAERCRSAALIDDSSSDLVINRPFPGDASKTFSKAFHRTFGVWTRLKGPSAWR